MEHRRTSHQSGSLTIAKRSKGPDVWCLQWRERTADGSWSKRKQVLGTKADLPTKAAAQKKADTLRLAINAPSCGIDRTMTIGLIVDHYKQHELIAGPSKSTRTVEVYQQHIRDYILPKWAGSWVSDVRPIPFEKWLGTVPNAPSTRTKTKNILSAIFQHGIRYGWVEHNPMRSVRSSSERVKKPDVLTAEETRSLLTELFEPARTIVLLAATTGLRRGEIKGLKWEDVNLEKCRVSVRRSMVDKTEGPPKTQRSRRTLSIDVLTVAALKAWRSKTRYGRDIDWVFASDYSAGDQPIWFQTLLTRQVQPTAKRLGIGKSIGWHTFRRTHATLQVHTGANNKVLQDQLGHSDINTSMRFYADSVAEDREAGQKAVAMAILPNDPLWSLESASAPSN